MNLLLTGWDLRMLWLILPLLSKLCLLFLLVIAGFTVISSAKVLLFARHSSNSTKTRNEEISQQEFANQTDRLASLRQLHLFAFYFFGACLADHLFAATGAMERSRMSLQAEGVEEFGPLAWFAFVGFLFFLGFHSFQWLAAFRLQRFCRLDVESHPK